MKKNILNYVLIISIVLLALLVVILASLTVFKQPTPEEVYSNAQSFVVELRSYTGDSRISYGSAVFVNAEGYIVTNAHLVVYKSAGVYEVFDNFEIRYSYEEEYHKVELVKYDTQKDIAILKLSSKTSNIGYANISRSANKAGDKVYAVGNGLNHGIGINSGIINLPLVSIIYEDKVCNVIQCDIVINEGNSGGALLNEMGELIGITTFRLKDSGGSIVYGIAYAIPIGIVMDYFSI